MTDNININMNITHLVLSGGGMHGVMFIGALRYLYFKKLLILDDSDATELYTNDGSILLMDQLLRDDENFIDLI